MERAFFESALSTATFKGHPIEHRDDGTALVSGVTVFRAGTFRDSMGEQRTWTLEHLNMMVGHFELLRSQGVFGDVPVRRDHSMSVDKVMGYIDALRVEGDRLVADYTITEPSDIEKLARGTYRNVSLEVGMYVTNDEAAYWPVVFGFAYVDIPAVEGLHSKTPELALFSQIVEPPKEPSVSKQTLPPDVGAPKPDTADHAAATEAVTGTPAAVPAAPAVFRVRGQETSDFAAVQRHIESLEKFVDDTIETGRKDFVTALVTDGKIVAPQREAMEKLVVEMSDEQYEAFKAAYAAAPSLSLLANHGAGNPNPEGQNANPVNQEIADLEEQLAMHRRAGLSPEKIANTKAAKRLAELTNKS